MRKYAKFAAACAVIVTVTALTACSENGNVPAQNGQSRITQSVSSTLVLQSAETSQGQSSQGSQKQSEQSSSVKSSSVKSSTSSKASSSAVPQSAPAEGLPENPSEGSIEYSEKAFDIIDKYLSTVMGNQDELETLWIDPDTDESAAAERMKEYLIDCSEKGEGYLDELEKLTPTEEMSAFHNGLVELMNIMRDYSDIAKTLENIDINDDAAGEAFMNKVELLFARFNEEYVDFCVKYPGFGGGLANGEWQKNGSTTSQYIMADPVENARDLAERLLTAIWTYGGTMPPNATLNINKTESVCEVTVDGGELQTAPKNDTSLGDAIFAEFMLNETFYARVFVNENGDAMYAAVSPYGKLDESEFPDRSAFENHKWKWKHMGVTPGGHILGTVPYLSPDKG